MKRNHWTLLLALLASVTATACGAEKAQKAPVQKSDVHVVMSTNRDVPVSHAKTPETAAIDSIFWTLSNGKTVYPSAQQVVNVSTFGDVSIVRLRVPGVEPHPVDYILVLTTSHGMWHVKGIIGTSFDPDSSNHNLPNLLNGQTNLIKLGVVSVTGVGKFFEYFSPSTLVNIFAVPHAFPAPKAMQQKTLSSRIQASLYSDGNHVGLYYPYRNQWIVITGNVSTSDLLDAANRFNVQYFNL
ncbi:hypothetical protein [Alicyclobacillus vulcanalis]|uniref:Uncharacterized protein n=1 Tax=Alicyclobacillus vulcanalis TaxID=252246 RepID=A0A1N7N611_9BACL|nr:hypothetical protein [Alicyclobacillus vulcanalis]SIS93581.1 hypothetical protein SAMN05421799_10786 [Alicyclobacillus vulcanalis]